MYKTFDDFPKTVRVDEVSATVTYIGLATSGTSETASEWRIQRVTDGNPLKIEYPKLTSANSPDSEPKFVWADRASYSYG